jgi:membrane-associated phospholipid phosphatase
LNGVAYFGIQNLVSFHVFDFLLPFDKQIPLIPEFIWVYNSLIPVLILSAAFLVRSKKMFYTTVCAFVLTTLVLDMCYIFMPSFYPRDPIVITGISTWFLELTRQIDGANNTFPSGHVALSWLLFWAISYSNYMNGRSISKILYGIWATGVSVATLALKQHYIVDVFGGFVVAAICYFAAKWFLENTKLIQETPEAQLAE